MENIKNILDESIGELDGYITYVEEVFKKMGFPYDTEARKYDVTAVYGKVNIDLEWQRIISDYVFCLEIVDIYESGGELNEKQENFIRWFYENKCKEHKKREDYYVVRFKFYDLQMMNPQYEIDFVMDLSGEVIVYSPVVYSGLKLPKGLMIDENGNISYNGMHCGKIKVSPMPKYAEFNELSDISVIAVNNIKNDKPIDGNEEKESKEFKDEMIFREKVSSYIEDVISISKSQELNRENIIGLINWGVTLQNDAVFPGLFLEIIMNNKEFLEAYRKLLMFAKNNRFVSELFNDKSNNNDNNNNEEKQTSR